MKGLTEYEKFLLLRKLPTGWPKDEKGIPYLKLNYFADTDWNNIQYTSLPNLNSTKNKENKIVLNFQYDKSMIKLWAHPIKYLMKFSSFYGVTTPDFSAYRNMEPWIVEENICHSLWLGAWYQFYGLNVIPTINWADERTYHICFDYVAKGSVVAISTIGVSKTKEDFLKGFNEMIKRIKPPLILVRGKPINGMIGNFIFVDFKETFESRYEQLNLFQLDRIQTFGREAK